MSKPTVIHIVNGDGRLCGTEHKGEWPNKYTTDEFARTLPICPNCLDIKGSLIEQTENECMETCHVDVPCPNGMDCDHEGAGRINKQKSLKEWCI